ncbi:Phage repressor [Moraxella catarrhalis]|uniref:Phage repressor n=2 Tax=Moraxella catarrhalis TaxID=480 RepID=A0A198UMP0_MORCA|nr:Phage repressor [Moraxella catarrhalis]OAU98826.1 Phage repressor [Moraxella catarrhalis]
MLKSISEIRLQNVEHLMRIYNIDRVAFAERAEINGSQLSQYFSGNKIIGDSVASRIEENFGLPKYWLDQNRSDSRSVKTVRNVPILTWVKAGLFHETGELQYDKTEPVYDEAYPQDVYWLTVSGDSMMPRFHEGDLILVDPNKQPCVGDFVVAIKLDASGGYEDAMTFKKYREGFDDKLCQMYYQLVPLNEDYAIIDSRHTPFEVRGVVLERKEKFV